jgi:hypothetical protein
VCLVATLLKIVNIHREIGLASSRHTPTQLVAQGFCTAELGFKGEEREREKARSFEASFIIDSP